MGGERAAELALQALKSKFLDSLEYRLLELENATTACRRRPTRAAFEDLSSLLHKLSGIAASFGFPNIGQQAQSAELLISQALHGEPHANWESKALTQVEALMDDIESVLES